METNILLANQPYKDRDSDPVGAVSTAEDSEILTQFKNIHTEEDSCFEAKNFLSQPMKYNGNEYNNNNEEIREEDDSVRDN